MGAASWSAMNTTAPHEAVHKLPQRHVEMADELL